MLEIKNICKKIGKENGKTFEIKNVNFILNSQDILLLLGKNGSGKSTLLKILCGLILPDEGEVLFDGKNILKISRTFYSSIGFFQGGKSSLDPSLSMEQNFEFTAYMYKCKKKQWRQTLDDFFNIFPILSEVQYKYVREMSLGQRTICELINSLIHLPEYLFLDEPTIGIDAENKQLIADFIRLYAQKYKITGLIVSTHDFDFTKTIDWHRAGIMENGVLSCITEDIDEAREIVQGNAVR